MSSCARSIFLFFLFASISFAFAGIGTLTEARSVGSDFYGCICIAIGALSMTLAFCAFTKRHSLGLIAAWLLAVGLWATCFVIERNVLG